MSGNANPGHAHDFTPFVVHVISVVFNLIMSDYILHHVYNMFWSDTLLSFPNLVPVKLFIILHSLLELSNYISDKYLSNDL